ncbi:UNVERIFIED_CONTAM: Aspartokinase, chloroplastic [Sesamum radiatum]|uniref:aspartate kinase n=1 Tax=Sesamum radiatum TaxID=300843 RepID=A0AAW2RZM3_SESRA
MSTALNSCNSRILFDRCSNEFNKNLQFSRFQLNFRNRHQFVDFASRRRLSAAVDRRKSPFFTICSAKDADVAAFEEAKFSSEKNVDEELTCVMKFGGSSVASAERMREVVHLILSFPEERPIVVLSAMGKTTNNLLRAGEKAVSCGHSNVSEIEELAFIKELHLRTVTELGIDDSVISGHLEELELLLNGIARLKELTLRTQDKLVSFGECMSTRIFAAYLNKIGTKARQYDAFDIGFVTTDDFTNAEILEATYPAVASKLYSDWINDHAIPIVTGFLGKVWKDVDGVLTCDPTIHPGAKPVPYLTFEEATELAYFGAQVLHPLSMRPAMDASIPVRVKNSYNPKAPGTLITRNRDMTKALLTSIVLKQNITMLDIVSTRMLGQFGFLAKVFSIFEDLGISVDVVATSEAFSVFRRINVNVQMISQGASKVNMSLIVNDSEAEQCIKALHYSFFESGEVSEKDLDAALNNGNFESVPAN